jgi:hypothetical protein
LAADRTPGPSYDVRLVSKRFEIPERKCVALRDRAGFARGKPEAFGGELDGLRSFEREEERTFGSVIALSVFAQDFRPVGL